jgi:hypothetical protein
MESVLDALTLTAKLGSRLPGRDAELREINNRVAALLE